MRPAWKARAASMRTRGLGILPMGSVGIATAEALCAAMPVARSLKPRPQAYTDTTPEALVG
jgi:hypothetical protein